MARNKINSMRVAPEVVLEGENIPEFGLKGYPEDAIVGKEDAIVGKEVLALVAIADNDRPFQGSVHVQRLRLPESPAVMKK